MKSLGRRDFLKFLGATSLTLSQFSLLTIVSSCKTEGIIGIKPNFTDSLDLAEGLRYEKIISWGDKINSLETFGFNNDYIAIEAIDQNKLLMWVNHEYANTLFVSGFERTKENVDKERRSVGGSIIEINKVNNKWAINRESAYNKGIRGDTEIPFANNIKVLNSKTATGTISNCAGGKTPWGTFLTCEENYHMNYGERNSKLEKRIPSVLQWEKFYNNPPEHYGWVVEVEPRTGKAKKHTSMGRFSHESATCIRSNNKVVVYTGDDKADEHLYKFISDSNTNLDSGKLYVANIKDGKWLSLDLEDSPILKKEFNNQLEVQMYTRKAAKILGATPLARPEDVEINPITKDVFISLTNNKKKKNYHGSILKISEDAKNHTSLSFKAETYILGGTDSGISCPDNLAFDRKGNLWICNDISGRAVGTDEYKSFGNNGIFVIPTQGKNAGKLIQIASAPIDAEFTGLCFSPDYKTLFVSVQHPGELSKNISKPTSSWPTGSLPKPTVVQIQGKFLEKLTL